MAKDELAAFIKKRREDLGWTQRQFAEIVNMDQSYIGRLETGKQLGSVESLITIAKALKVRPGYAIDLLADTLPDEEKRILPTIELPEILEVEDIKAIEEFIKYWTERRRKLNMEHNEQIIAARVEKVNEQHLAGDEERDAPAS
jgi:transcriptional regulator with XRE-family HTH domain